MVVLPIALLPESCLGARWHVRTVKERNDMNTRRSAAPVSKLSLWAILCVACSCALVLCLSACGNEPSKEKDDTVQETAAQEEASQDASEESEPAPSNEASEEAAASADEEAPANAEVPADKDKKTDAEKATAKNDKTDAEKATAKKKKPDTTDPALAKRLDEDVARIAESSGMGVNVAVIDLATGTKAGYKADEQMVSASMIKMIVAYSAMQKVAAGELALDDVYTLQYSDIVGGTGSLQGRGAGAEVSYRELVTLMISESDNVATNVLIDAVGFEFINKQAEELGLHATKLGRKMMDFEAQAQGQENYVSADDLALLFQMVHEKTFVNAEASELVLSALEAQVDTAGILGGLPQGVAFAHKTGTLDIVHHDGGIVEGDRPYVLVVLCGGEGFYEGGAYNAMAELARVTYEDIVNQAAAK